MADITFKGGPGNNNILATSTVAATWTISSGARASIWLSMVAQATTVSTAAA